MVHEKKNCTEIEPLAFDAARNWITAKLVRVERTSVRCTVWLCLFRVRVCSQLEMNISITLGFYACHNLQFENVSIVVFHCIRPSSHFTHSIKIAQSSVVSFARI